MQQKSGRSVIHRGGHDRSGETESGCFLETPLDVRHRTDLAAEPDLADGDRFAIDGRSSTGRGNRQGNRQVRCWFGEADTTCGRRKDVTGAESNTGVLVQHGEKESKSPAVDPLRAATRHGQR